MAFIGISILRVVFWLIAICVVVSTIGLALVVFRDAQERGISESTATIWALGTAILAPFVAPPYLLLVVRSHRRESSLQTREMWVIWLCCSFLFSFLSAAVLTPPDPFTQFIFQVVAFPLIALGTYLLVFKRRQWFTASQSA